MPDQKVPIILLDCDTRAIEGVIYSFGKRNIPVVALSAEKKPPAFHSRFVQQKYQSPPVWQEQAYLDFLLQLPERGVLLYADDASATFVSKHRDRLQAAGFLINILTIGDFYRGFDKGQLAEAATEVAVPIIPTLTVQSLADLQRAWETLDAPIILKATRLAGGKFELIRRKEELASAYETMDALIHADGYVHMHSGLIAQEFIHYDYDEIYCCEAFYTTESKPTGFLSIHKIRPNINRDGTAGGRLFAGETTKDEVLENHTRTTLDHLGWQGLAHLDWIYSKKYQQYLLCEINPRLPGFSNLLTKVGFEMAYYYYADLCQLPITPYRFQKALYFEAIRMPGDITTGVYAIMKGYLSLKSFTISYLRLLTFKHKVHIDIYYPYDLAFTLRSWSDQLLYLLKRPFRFLTR